MYINQDLCVAITHTIMKEAVKRETSQFALCKNHGLNAVTFLRSRKLNLPPPTRALLTCMSIVGVQESAQIIERMLIEAKKKKLDNIDSYLKDLSQNKKMKNMKTRASKKPQPLFKIADI